MLGVGSVKDGTHLTISHIITDETLRNKKSAAGEGTFLRKTRVIV